MGLYCGISASYYEETKGCILGTPYSSLSLGIETSGGVMTTFIPIAVLFEDKIVKYFTTDKDNQTKVIINIYEGERINKI